MSEEEGRQLRQGCSSLEREPGRVRDKLHLQQGSHLLWLTDTLKLDSQAQEAAGRRLLIRTTTVRSVTLQRALRLLSSGWLRRGKRERTRAVEGSPGAWGGGDHLD